MLDGVMLLWFILTGLSVSFVAVDVWKTPEATALRWGFIILTVFAGPLAAFFYVLGCREPLPGTHERYVAPTWKQVLGSTMHCASGDGLGIITGAAVASVLALPFALDLTLEYVLGFGFGWLFFQAFAMRDMAGGDYVKSLRMTFIPEFLSMNILMAGMLLVSKAWMAQVPGSSDPSNATFWFIMSMSLVAGFLCAYPMNWWLVTRHLKHGMMTVHRQPADSHATHAGHEAPPPDAHASHHEHPGHAGHAGHEDPAPDAHASHHEHPGHAGHGMGDPPSSGTVLMVAALSVVILTLAVLLVTTLIPATP